MIFTVDITCYPTSNSFAAGNRIRLDISGSNFPHFDLNPNTGEPLGKTSRTQIARNSIHFGTECPSKVVIPVERGH